MTSCCFTRMSIVLDYFLIHSNSSLAHNPPKNSNVFFFNLGCVRVKKTLPDARLYVKLS